MFDLGTKIVILASTRKKGVGPRKGSLGYASSCQNRGTFDQYGLAATLNEVFFFRYGFETQERVEKKAIISIFPIIKPDQGDIHDQVRSLVKRVYSPKSSQVWDEIRAYFDVVPRVPITVAAPLNCHRTDLSKVGTKEFYAWLESLFLGTPLLSFLNDAVNSQHVTNSETIGLGLSDLEMFRTMAMDRGFKQARMKEMASDEFTRKHTVELLRPLIAFAGRWETKNTINGYESYLANSLPMTSGKFPPNLLLDHLSTYIYTPAIVAAFRRTLASVGHKQALRVMEDIEYTKAEIMVLSSQLWRAGLVDGKSASKV